MRRSQRRDILIGGAAVVSLLTFSETARTQTALPEIVVRAPSPIVRPAPAPTAPAEQTPAPAPAAEAPFPGTLPIVTGQFATVTVVPSDELRRSPGTNLGDLLFDRPGISATTFAPGAASRPIIRGQSNYRVRIQENGIAVNDVSDLSEDHAVPIDPLAASQVEVVRGPATLRWGSQAIGGVVNVTNNRIPETLPARPLSVETRGAFSSVDRGTEGAMLVDGRAGNVAFHADMSGRRAGDYSIPGYPYLFPPDPPPIVNSKQPNSAMNSAGQAAGGSYFFDGGYVGVAVAHFASLYRIPGADDAAAGTRIDMEQTKVTSKGEYRPQSFAIEAIRFWLGVTDYKHRELGIGDEGVDGVRQTFTNQGQEGRVEVQLTPFDLRFASLTTAVGVQAAHQQLTAPGDNNGLFDPNQTTSVAAFVFNEFKFGGGWRAQAAGRIEKVKNSGSSPDFPSDFLPDGSELIAAPRKNDFTPKSASFGLLKDLPWDMVGSITGQYVERAPRAPELYSRGAHDATGTFEIGNPNLNIEAARMLEVGLRRAVGPLRFEATAYYTKYAGFIFKQITGVKCGGDFASCGDPDGTLDQIVYSQRDATFRGGEFQSQLDIAPLLTGTWGVESQFDIVRATFTDGTNVPRIPPERAGGGVFWHDANWLMRVNLLHAFAHTDIAENETPTPGYNLLKAEISYTKKLKPTGFGAQEVTVGVTGNNLLNEDIRNSASFKKDEVLLPGRSFRLFANVKY